ncbi:NAD-dependent epimerase/dehydratase family protein [Microbulbifer agarilyticus]|uniref:NAD-dependent epimerase/dehydratase family protein n=1 Tax=Microbulbifer agarilyticus TaxID=260552 RepID=UPI001C98AC64|nr:NAD-dependent epimerase/dehydratase family protein [Microbulbifer agarilyticus]MBY6189668.1 NAD-dependent epimerase/dehydratase family protein [Microbulbifer agarilyticus]
MRWVIVGSSGYIGSALSRYLLAAGDTVISVSRRSEGPAGTIHHQVETLSLKDCAGLFLAGDRVIYAAGIASAGECRRRPDMAESVNCHFPAELLDAAAVAQADSFLYLSSVKAVTPPNGQLARENDGQPATDAYGGSKWSAEQKMLASPAKIRVNVLRPAAVYGEYQGGRDADLVGTSPVAKKRAMAWRQKFRLWGRIIPRVPATGFRSFVALDDLLAAIRLIVESDCDREVFIAAEPQYCDLSLIGSAASGRIMKNSYFLTALLGVVIRSLSASGVKTGLLEVGRSELYSSARLRTTLNWRPLRRYRQFLQAVNEGS